MGPMPDDPGAPADPLPVRPVGPFDASVRPPGSKSLTNRLLLLAALAAGESVLRGALTDADDAQRMITALRAMGVGIDAGPDAVRIRGCGGHLTGGVRIELGNAGTATRFLTAAACLADRPVEIDGDPRMRERPIGELVTLLRALGVRIDELGEPGRVPLRVHPARRDGGELAVPTTLSSQYISALLLAAPWMETGLTLRFEGPVTSVSYVRMTVDVLRRVAAGIEHDAGWRWIRVEPWPVGAFEIDIEADASGATYFWAAAAMVPGARCTVEGIPEPSVQGDAAFVDVLARMGAGVGRGKDGVTVMGPERLRGIDADLSLMPDAAMTLAAVACVAEGPTTITGLRTLRVKETDRIAALVAELSKIGAGVEVITTGDDEGIVVDPPAALGDDPVEFETYDDHRMAMSLALLGLRRGGVWIRDPGCVAKTYPGFWSDLARATGAVGGGGAGDG